MIYFKSIIALGFIVFILDKLYILPIYVPLDTKPTDFRSSAYLAKSIAHAAHADIELAFVEYEYDENATVFYFNANIKDVPFTIEIYLEQNMRDIGFKNSILNKDKLYNRPCFKAGKFYIICETYRVKSKKDKPIFRGAQYYSQFPGEDIIFTENK